MGISAHTLYLYNFLKVPEATEYQILTHDKVLAFLPIFPLQPLLRWLAVNMLQSSSLNILNRMLPFKAVGKVNDVAISYFSTSPTSW